MKTDIFEALLLGAAFLAGIGGLSLIAAGFYYGGWPPVFMWPAIVAAIAFFTVATVVSAAILFKAIRP